MTWPIVEGVSLMHLHVNRGKRSVVIDLRTDEGVELFLDLVREADVVVEAMRPGGLARRGLSLRAAAARSTREIVQCTISGYGATGPVPDLASHGIAYDAWAGIFTPETDANGYPGIPDHVSIGINAGPLFGALGILAAIIHARATGDGAELELAQSDAAAAFDWYRGETYRAYERPESEVTGNKSDDYVRREPAIAGMRGGVRYALVRVDRRLRALHVERAALLEEVLRGRRPYRLFEKWPGSQYGDHARGNLEMQAELTEIFKAKTTAEWIDFGIEVNVPIAPIYTPHTVQHDPQFLDRMEWFPADVLGADQLPFPVKIAGQEPLVPDEGARGRRAHRRGPARRPRLRRRQDRRAARRRRHHLTRDQPGTGRARGGRAAAEEGERAHREDEDAQHPGCDERRRVHRADLADRHADLGRDDDERQRRRLHERRRQHLTAGEPVLAQQKRREPAHQAGSGRGTRDADLRARVLQPPDDVVQAPPLPGSGGDDRDDHDRETEDDELRDGLERVWLARARDDDESSTIEDPHQDLDHRPREGQAGEQPERRAGSRRPAP